MDSKIIATAFALFFFAGFSSALVEPYPHYPYPKLEVQEGWNLIPVGTDTRENYPCTEKIRYTYHYSPLHKKFIVKERVSVLDMRDISGSGGEQDAMRRGYESYRNTHRIPESIGTGMWAYFSDACTLALSNSIDPPKSGLKLFPRAWNTVAVSGGMVGKNLRDIFACDVSQAYTYDAKAQKWTNEMYYPKNSLDDTINPKIIEESDIGTVYLINPAQPCAVRSS